MQILAYILIKRGICLCVLVHVFIQVTYHYAPSRLQGDRYHDFHFLISKHARLFKVTPSRPCTAAVALLCGTARISTCGHRLRVLPLTLPRARTQGPPFTPRL